MRFVRLKIVIFSAFRFDLCVRVRKMCTTRCMNADGFRETRSRDNNNNICDVTSCSDNVVRRNVAERISTRRAPPIILC